jgi:phosphoribosylformimino-5-aminoimidazole carboxamide ribotide isomerase
VAANNSETFLGWLKKYGNSKIILGADCRDRKISTNGWQNSSELDVVDFIKEYEKAGISYVICTDIAKDGMLQGTSIELYSEILADCNVNLIASGGITSLNELVELKKIGCEGAIIGKAIYEGKISIKDLKDLC